MKHVGLSVAGWAGLAVSGLLLATGSMYGQAVPSPNLSLYAGAPASTYNGATGGAICTGSLNTIGDGCVPTMARFIQPYGTAIDSLGNIYTADNSVSDAEIRVVYQGGSALAAALIAANPSETFTPTAGHVYGFGARAQTLTTAGAFCAGTSGATTYDTLGDGCPAQYGVFTPRDVFVDANGNIFFTSLPNGTNWNVGYASVRVIYVGGTTVANLIKGYNTSITTVTPGTVYALSASGDFYGSLSSTSVPVNTPDGIGSIVADTSGNLYVSDTGTQTGNPAVNASSSIKKLSAASPASGWSTYIGTGPNGSTQTYMALGDGGPATSATVNTPTTLYIDANNNLYICDTGDSRVRVVYSGGVTPPLYSGNNNASTPPTTIVTSPVPGDIYTVVGGAAYSGVSATSLGNLATLLALDGVPSTSRPQAAQFNPYSPVLIGMDPQGNLIVGGKMTYTGPVTNTIIYRIDATTGTVTVIGGVDASASNGSLAATPASGAYCNGGTKGPTMTDAYGDGCPSIEVDPLYPYGRFVFDSAGNFYGTEERNASVSTVYQGGIIRKYTFPQKLGTSAVGSTLTVPVAFGFAAASTSNPPLANTPTVAFTNSGNSTTEFSDASTGSNDVCSVYQYALTGTGATPYYVENCVFYVAFTPAQAGSRLGSVTVSGGTSSTTVLGTVALGGTGVGAELTADPGTSTVLGSGLSPSGLGIDQSGNFFISDATSNKVYKSTGGGTPAVFSTGSALKAPGQIAVSGTGVVFVADPGYNLVDQLNATTGNALVPASTVGGTSLSAPLGVAVDQLGNLYVADTGNNRIVEYSYSDGGGSTSITATGISVLPITGLKAPKGLAVDAAGDLFIADSGNARIVEYSAIGVQSTVSLTSTLTTPVGVQVDAAGDLFIADSGANTILLVPAGSTTATTLKSGVTGLNGIAVDSYGNVAYSATPATGTTGITVLNRNTPTFAFANTAQGSTTSTVLTLSNAGNGALTTGTTLVSSTDTTDFAIAGATTNGCTASETIVAGGNCGLSATFQPQSAAALSTTLTFPTTNAADSVSYTLTGTGTAASNISTTTTIGTSPTTYGQTAAIVVTVTPATGTASPTGTVMLTVDSSTTPLSGTLSNGMYTFNVSNLQAGNHTFSAAYGGGTGFASSSTASPTMLTVSKASLTVTGVCANRIFDQMNVCSNATVTGYAYTDSAGTVFAATPGSTSAALPNSPAGPYTAAPTNTALSTFGATDYTVTTANGTFTVTGNAPQKITFPQLPNLAHNGTYQLTARSSSGLAISYTITTGGSIASVSGSSLTITGTGTVTVTATTVTDATGDYAAAPSVSVTFTAQ